MSVRKDPAIFFDLWAHLLKSFELHKFGPCEPYRAAASVRLWRIDLAIVHRLPDPKALVLPIYGIPARSEEHTSELQSLAYLVCRLLLEKKNKILSLRLGRQKKTKKLSKQTKLA